MILDLGVWCKNDLGKDLQHIYRFFSYGNKSMTFYMFLIHTHVLTLGLVCLHAIARDMV
jgi:hypothetical protein